ncbi:MAG: carboxypeptidase-like regulatory domain-containing protein [Planctomycetota bacterium]
MLASLAFCIALVPQGGVKTAGTVVDVDGSPVANAQVTFLSRQIPRALHGVEDRRVATTDERGRYRVELAKETSYSAWATWPERATDVVEGVMGGSFLGLRGVPGTGSYEVRIDGIDAWPDHAEFTVRALVGASNVDFVPCEREGDGFRVPPLPPMTVRAIEVLDPRGEIVAVGSAQNTQDGYTFAMSPPVEFPIEVVDAQGAPVAGAEVRWHIRNYWYSADDTLAFMQRFRSPCPVVARTDADGEADVRVPEKAVDDLWLITSKDGFRMSIDGFHRGQVVQGGVGTGDVPKPRQLRVVLKQADVERIDLTDRGLPQAEGFLRMGLRIYVKSKNSTRGTILPFNAPIEDGKAVFRSPLPAKTEVELLEVSLTDVVRDKLRERFGFAPRFWRLAEPETFAVDKVVEDPLGLRDARMVQVTAADGRPAAHVGVLYRDDRGSTMGVRVDRLGRALISGHVGRGSPIGSCSMRGFAARSMPEEISERVLLQLQEMVPLAVRVEVDGDPVAEPVLVQPTGLQPDEAEGGDGVGAAGAWIVEQASSLLPGVWSDASGVVMLRLPPIGGRLSLRSSRKVVDGGTLVWEPGRTKEHVVTIESR